MVFTPSVKVVRENSRKPVHDYFLTKGAKTLDPVKTPLDKRRRVKKRKPRLTRENSPFHRLRAFRYISSL